MIACVTALKPYPVSPERAVPDSIQRPAYVGKTRPERYTGSHVQTPETIAKMAVAGRIAAQALVVGQLAIAPGVTTDEIDAAIHDFLIEQGAYPSTLGYRGFPKACCTSVNEVICHGIPDARPLEDGDLLKIDVTAFIDGVHGDNCATYAVGTLDEESRLLMERTKEAMERGIRAVRPGREINVIGRVIEAYAKRFNYGVVRDYTGHGVHSAFHSGLVIPHFDQPAYSEVMEPGMTFTIEPMLAMGDQRSHVWDDDWTVVTNDGSRVAQFEQTLVVTEDGAKILTTV
jgi:methionyl aminopeptidase